MLTQSIGGLFLGVSNDIQFTSPQDLFAGFASFSHQINLVEQDIKIKLAYASSVNHIDLRDAIFSTQYFNVYTVADGFQLLRFRDEQQQIPWLSIHTDPHFSVFNCCCYEDIDLHKTPTIDLYRTAADAFLLQHSFINRQGLIIHAAGGSFNGKGMVFAGPSGAGKSTLSLLLNSSPQNQLFSDERVIVRSIHDGWHVWGTPWHGTGNIARNEQAPLSALVFLSQAKETKITPLSPSAGLRRLLQVVSIPWYSAEWTNKGLAVCESLIQVVPMFELAFCPDQTAAQAVADLASSLN